MQKITCICDICETKLREETPYELSGVLSERAMPEVNVEAQQIRVFLDDICQTCAIELKEAITDLKIRRKQD
jgi:hypothetical protein